MAVSVDTVYRTVLLILNKEQRGYMTPDEFNKTAAQVQLEIFNKYFDDLNQLLRVPQTDLDYADRVKLLDEKIAIFKTSAIPGGGTLGVFTAPNNTRELGSVIYNETEIQRVQRNEFYDLNKSKLTKPSEAYPIYLYENNLIKVYPITITTGVSVNYLRKLVDPAWNFTTNQSSNYQYIFTPTTDTESPSIDFELHISEQANIIIRILMYSGVIIQDVGLIQVAAQQIQNEQVNSKS
jgi:hypothetical protein